MALLLAIDTATKRCSVVLCEGPHVLTFREEENERLTHAERLNVLIGEVMAEAGFTLRDLAAVAVGIGPGSYTGLRIGLSAAKGLCYALRIPIIGMSTLDVLVRELMTSAPDLPPNALLMPMIDARRMEVFTLVAGTDGGHLTEAKPMVLDQPWPEASHHDGPIIVFGDGADKATELWAVRPDVRHVPGIRPSHQGLSSLASALFERQAFSDLAYLVPDYGKPANVTQPGKRAS